MAGGIQRESGNTRLQNWGSLAESEIMLVTAYQNFGIMEQVLSLLEMTPVHTFG